MSIATYSLGVSSRHNSIPDLLKQELPHEVLEKKRKIVEKLYSIFNQKGVINNKQLLSQFNNSIDDIRSSLSDKEKGDFDNCLQEKMELLGVIKAKGYNNLETFSERQYEGYNDDDEDVPNEDQENQLSQEDIDLIARIDQYTANEESIYQNSWRLKAIRGLTGMSKSLQKQIGKVEDFQSGNRTGIYQLLKPYETELHAIKNGDAKILYTPFGITFLIREVHKSRPKNIRGFQIRNSPISIVYVGKGGRATRSTLEHEARHNIFGILQLDGKFYSNPRQLQSRIEHRIMLYKRFQESDAPSFIVDEYLIGNLNIVDPYIDGLKDEVLANFDNLIEGFGSTDMSHSRAFLRFLEQIDTIFESYKDDSAIYGQKDILKQKSQDKMKSFYQELSFYCFIARNGSKEIKESIRQLLYLTSMSNLSDLEIALRGIIGESTYEALHMTYPLLNNIHLDETLLGKKSITTTAFKRDFINTLLGEVQPSKPGHINTDNTVKREYLTDDMLTAFYKTCQYFLQSGDTTTPFGMMDKDPNLRNIAAHVAYSLSKGSGWKKKFITLMS